jgi:hypothetical protein
MIYKSTPKSSENKNGEKHTVKSLHDGISMTALSIPAFFTVLGLVLALSWKAPETLFPPSVQFSIKYHIPYGRH